MTEVNVDGVQKLSAEDLETLKGDPTKIDDATLEAMAAKSGDTVEHMKEILGLFKDPGSDPGSDPASAPDDKLFAGKYKTEEDLDKGIQSLIDKYGKEKAYKMLESEISNKQINDNADNGVHVDALSTDEEKAAAEKAKADAVANDQKLDMNKYFDEYSESNQLSIESYKELNDAGYDKDLVDAYIEGQRARVELFTNQVHSLAGGEEQFNAMVAWGTVNLDDAQKTIFNDAVNSGNLSKAQSVLEGLKVRYENSEGTFQRNKVEPTDNIHNSAVEGFASSAEMSTAMRDPRYRTDAAYVAKVQKRMAASKF